MKEICMTMNQFKMYSDGILDLKDIQKLNTISNKIIGNKRLEKLTVITLALTTYPNYALAGISDAEAKIGVIGSTFLGLFQTLGYWTCVIFCIIEILKSALNGTNKNVGKIIMKYVLMFGSLYFLPFIFDLIKDVFA